MPLDSDIWSAAPECLGPPKLFASIKAKQAEPTLLTLPQRTLLQGLAAVAVAPVVPGSFCQFWVPSAIVIGALVVSGGFGFGTVGTLIGGIGATTDWLPAV